MAKLRLPFPIRNYSGTDTKANITYGYNRRTGTPYAAKRPTKVNQPNSADQLFVRAAIGAANKNWCQLSDAARFAWEIYAMRHYPATGNKSALRGQHLYVQCMVHRQIMNLPLTNSAPETAPPPGAVISLSGGVAGGPDQLVFTPTHNQPLVAAHRLYVRATSACTLHQTPVVAKARAVRNLAGGASAVALTPSGVPVTITSTRYAYADTTQLGLRLAILREADGMSSTAFFGIFAQSIG